MSAGWVVLKRRRPQKYTIFNFAIVCWAALSLEMMDGWAGGCGWGGDGEVGRWVRWGCWGGDGDRDRDRDG